MRNFKSLEEFIEKVEAADFWDAFEDEDYRDALEEVGLDYDKYDDPDIMWDDFLKAVKERGE